VALTYLSLGSNVGDRAGSLREALKRLGGAGVEVLAVSGMLETAPYGVTDQPAFLNCAAKCSTSLTPPELLAAALGVERDMGRVRERRWGPRNIDIDIIFYDGYRQSESESHRRKISEFRTAYVFKRFD